jgi:adenine phosphoribosyltransferase
MDLKEKIRTVEDFPTKGTSFGDITTLLQDSEALNHCIDLMVAHYADKGINKIVATESRGFIFGAILAHQLNAGFIPLRKPGKLPWKTIKQEFQTEYSKDAFEIHIDAIKKGDSCLLVDDIIATGGTTEAGCKLIEKLGGRVTGVCTLMELTFLGAQEKLKQYEVFSLIKHGKE